MSARDLEAQEGNWCACSREATGLSSVCALLYFTLVKVEIKRCYIAKIPPPQEGSPGLLRYMLLVLLNPSAHTCTIPMLVRQEAHNCTKHGPNYIK